jgi:N-acetylmuramoyl-L-alanine amidase
MSRLTNIIVHCSDSRWGCARAIRQWHQAKGWKDIGYHFVILNGQFGPGFYVEAANGSIEAGRYMDQDDMVAENEVGAHCLGYNENSVGICLVGKDTFTSAQLESLASLVKELQRAHNIPTTNVLGHCETASGKKEGKSCPNFDMKKFREACLK